MIYGVLQTVQQSLVGVSRLEVFGPFRPDRTHVSTLIPSSPATSRRGGAETFPPCGQEGTVGVSPGGRGEQDPACLSDTRRSRHLIASRLDLPSNMRPAMYLPILSPPHILLATMP